jgi:hypothetical protein
VPPGNKAAKLTNVIHVDVIDYKRLEVGRPVCEPISKEYRALFRDDGGAVPASAGAA